ncbi:1-acylglycerol-3-phosphate O-acyltransferase Pnpla3-like [Ctenocephalides felis]|uniref:1-acylglycerol-3-phosphate O-acyltransferase Pnpla3-like n=1 Tax=Ctenocephalides felis TaxID=7515 RepID=UPI000E6E49E1|nr:1-acylglycerol-3-phosphate O-acyltransferase Pnpla3-like [Ctenocephalides felis]
MTSDVLRVVNEARKRSLGPLSPSFNIQNVLLEGLQKFLPEDAHLRVNGKLHISLTRVYDGKNVIVSQFNSREDLLQALLASCFIPVFSGLLPPRFHGIRYMDGGFSDNLPTIDENTVTVSPFCGESDICPRDESSQLFHVNFANTSIELSRQNINRFARILFPPKPEVLSNMCKQGFDDALRFLHRNNMINCTRCLAVQSTFIVSDTLDESIDYDPQCLECKNHRQEALVANLPETVLTVFQNAIDSANKGLVNWMFRHRGMKLLTVLSIPYTLPADIVYATLTNLVGDVVETRSLQYKVLGNSMIHRQINRCSVHYNHSRLMSSVPSVSNQLWDLSKIIIERLNLLLHTMNNKTQKLTANLTWQMVLSDFHKMSYSRTPFDIEAANAVAAPKNALLDVTYYSNNNEVLTTRSLHPQSISSDNDTFEQILEVTKCHDAVMAYYYMDDNNKIQVTEIFDVTDSDSPALQSPVECEANNQLQFDSECDNTELTGDDNDSLLAIEYAKEGFEFDLSDASGDDLDDLPTSIFSDPESEWSADQSNEIDYSLHKSDLRPESEQSNKRKEAQRRSYYSTVMEV